MSIIDFSLWRPSAATLKGAGVTAVIRYIGWDGEPGFADLGKNLTTAEAARYLDAGMDIGLTFEYAADAARHGGPQGTKDGSLASHQVHNLGFPGIGMLYAVDFDIPDYAPHLPDGPEHARAKLGPAGDYFQAIAETKPNHQINGYGGYWAVRRLLDAGLITRGWQTYAWSGGQWDSRAVLRQVAQAFGGQADVNLHEGTADDWGQWPRPVKRHTGPARVVADGKTSLRRVAIRYGTGVPAAVWETAQKEPGGFGGLQTPYVRAGNWDAVMPKGMIVWVP